MIEKDNAIPENTFKNISKNVNGYGFLYIDKFKKKIYNNFNHDI